jgi:probable rRNA maturation factor
MITVINKTNYKFSTIKLKQFIKIILAMENATGDVNVYFVPQKKIQNLNKKFLNKNMSTDVLSFPIDFKGKSNNPILGDIIICPQYVFAQKKSSFELIYNKPLKNKNNEINFLIIHGILHLLGYDHIEKIDKNIMFKKQYKYFTENI